MAEIAPPDPAPIPPDRQAELEERLQKLSVAVEQTPAVVMITDVHGTIEYVNPAFEQVTGYTRSEAIGANPRILRSGQMSEAVYREMWATITAGQIWRGEFCNRKKNGELYWDLGTVSPLRSPDGAITNYISVKEDITERKKIEAELQQHRDYLETLVQARTAELTAEITERKRAEETLREKERRLAEAQRIGQLGSWEWEVTTGQLSWSDEGYRIMGIDPAAAELNYANAIALVHPEDRERVRAALDLAVANAQPLTLDHRVIRPDGQERVVNIHAEPWNTHSMSRPRLVGTIQDITERVRIAAELLEKERMSKELDIARKIQFSMLPKACPVLEGWQFAAFYQPARQIGGDFYDFIKLPQGRIGVVIADVVDKGVPAALTMSLSRAIVRSIAGSGVGPSAILVHANQILLNDQIANAFVTTLFASLDPHTGHIELANAGHNRPLWYSSAARQVNEIKTQGMAMGLYPNVTIEQKAVEILPGDVLLFYTDGLSEAINTQDEFYGEERLAEVFGAHHQQDAQEILDAIHASWLEFTAGTEQADDVSMVVVKRIFSL
jgi:PAS domain S-box-containing protein